MVGRVVVVLLTRKKSVLTGDDKMNKKAQMDGNSIATMITGCIIVGIIYFFIVLYPLLKPWWAEQEGKAEFAQANENRKITLLEAIAKIFMDYRNCWKRHRQNNSIHPNRN